MRVHPLTKAVTLGFCSAALVACGGDDNNDSTTAETDTTAEVRVVHAASDAPNVNVALNNSQEVGNLAYATGKGLLEVEEGDYDVSVDAILPPNASKDTKNVISASGVTLSADKETTIVAAGNVGDKTIGPLVVTAPDADPASGKARIQVVHASDQAAAAAGALDVYLTGPNDSSLSDNDPVGTFEFEGNGSNADPTSEFDDTIGPAEVDAGKARIRVTPNGKKSPVIFDSGEISLGDGQDLLLAAIDNTGPSTSNTSSVKLLAAPEGAKSFIIPDADSKTAVRVGHVSTNARDQTSNNGVDVRVGGNTVRDNFNFGNLEPRAYLTSLTGGSYDIEVRGPMGGDLGLKINGATLAPQTYNTVYAVNEGSSGIKLVPETDEDLRPVDTEVRFRVFHGSQNAVAVGGPEGAVDVYVLPTDQTPQDVTRDAAAIKDLKYTASAQASADADGGATFDLFVTLAGSSIPQFKRENLSVSNDEVWTLVARDDGSGGVTAIAENDTDAQ